ncbi:MAG: hypothetical protein QOF39_3563 [Frankiales bacterium]|nr:hypothetical protein [Frankiales bacterium]
MKSGMRRLTARCATAALVATAVLSSGIQARAWNPGTPIGTATFEPVNGLDANTLTISTSGPCSDPSATNAQVIVYGAGFPATGQNVTANYATTALPGNAAGGYDLSLGDTMQTFALQQTPPATLSGKYDFVFACRAPIGSVDYGDYVGSIWFTDPTHYQSAAPAATTTTLTASPASPVTGTPLTLKAAVAPSNAAGAVQFLDGTVVLGTAPVTAGTATLVTSSLSAGVHSLTAKYISSGPPFNVASTSAALSVTVAPAVVVVAVPAPVVKNPSAFIVSVGTLVTCPGGSKTAIPAAELNNAISCAGGGAFLLVAKGAAPHALVAPTLAGTGKVGTKLTLKPGVWMPNYSSRTVVWKRDGKVISKQTGATYVVKKTDKGHRISATMTAHLAGHLDGTASTAALKAKALSSSNSAAVSLSTSAVPAAVAGDATPIGIPVGTAIGCFAAGFTGATSTTLAWLLDGAPYSAPAVMQIPDGLIGHVLTCRTTGTNAGGTTTSDAVINVVPGARLLSYLKPHIAGVAKVGKKLSAVAGKWSPVYTKATFVWLRDGKVIKGATKSTYVAKATDKKHKIAVRVTASRLGWGTGTATSAPMSIG